MTAARAPAHRGRRRALLPLVGLTLAVGLLLHHLDLSAVGRALAGVDPQPLTAAAALVTLGLGLASMRLAAYLRAADQPRALRRCAQAVCAGCVLNVVLPARGGDLAKALMLRRRGDEPLTPLIGAALLERLGDLQLLLLIGAAGAFALGRPRQAALVGAAALAPPLVLLVLRSDAVARRLGRLRPLADAAAGSLRRPHQLLLGLALSGLFWLLLVIVVALLLRACGGPPLDDATLQHVAAATPLAILIGTLPLSIAGIGTRDAAFVALLAPLATAEVLAAVALLYTVLTYALPALIGAAALGAGEVRALRRRLRRGDATGEGAVDGAGAARSS
ncbi:MAG: lysylphosphatidylglycerol synthase transmembrane domain-containing protein [Acidobacteriota bacterium]